MNPLCFKACAVLFRFSFVLNGCPPTFPDFLGTLTGRFSLPVVSVLFLDSGLTFSLRNMCYALPEKGPESLRSRPQVCPPFQTVFFGSNPSDTSFFSLVVIVPPPPSYPSLFGSTLSLLLDLREIFSM